MSDWVRNYFSRVNDSCVRAWANTSQKWRTLCSGHLKSNLRHKNWEQARRTPAPLINCPFDLSIKGRKKFLSSLVMNICRPSIIVFTRLIKVHPSGWFFLNELQSTSDSSYSWNTETDKMWTLEVWLIMTMRTIWPIRGLITHDPANERTDRSQLHQWPVWAECNNVQFKLG